MQFRKAELSDYNDLADLISRAIASIKNPVYPDETYIQWTASYTKKSTLTGKIADPDSYFALLTKGDRILGEGILTGNEIHGVYADPEYPGKGIGTEIMDHLEEHALKLGIDEIHIDSSLPAVGFYEKRGYKDTGPMLFDLDGYPNPGRVMKKKIGKRKGEIGNKE